MIRTRLGIFASELDHTVRPLLRSLGMAGEALADVVGGVSPRDVALGMRHVAERLDGLRRETAERTASIYVAGPAKSGKSTLVNALAGAWVTRASELPTYPAAVRLGYAPAFAMELERHGGSSSRIDDPGEARELLRQALAELAARIATVEEEADAFDPLVHARDAIARIRVQVPAEELAHTGLELVELPGDSRFLVGREGLLEPIELPASAVLVLRTPDLFARPFFAGFEALLERFERLHVVWNVDARGLDVAADGSPARGAQVADPNTLLESFRANAPGAAWRRASDEGRLQWHRIDVAAAAMLRMGGGELERPHDGGAARRELGVLAEELVSGLDLSSETRSILEESLRTSTASTDRVAGLCQAGALVELRQELARLKDERSEGLRQRDAIARLGRLGPAEWRAEASIGGGPEPAPGAAGSLAQTLGERAAARSRSHVRALTRAVSERLGVWFESDMSLQSFLDGQLGPLFRVAAKELAVLVAAELRAVFEEGTRAFELVGGIREDLEAARLHFDELGRRAAARVDLTERMEPVEVPLRLEDIPVRKTLADHLLVRRMPQVRRRLFGPEERPERALSDEGKAERLEEGARETLAKLLDERAQGFVVERTQALCAQGLERFLAALTAELGERLAGRTQQLEPRLAALERRIEESEGVRERVLELEQVSRRTREELDELGARYLRSGDGDVDAGGEARSESDALRGPGTHSETSSDAG